jgi:hypothetical protein
MTKRGNKNHKEFREVFMSAALEKCVQKESNFLRWEAKGGLKFTLLV